MLKSVWPTNISEEEHYIPATSSKKLCFPIILNFLPQSFFVKLWKRTKPFFEQGIKSTLEKKDTDGKLHMTVNKILNTKSKRGKSILAIAGSC